ncbi:hypothetical protein [Vibrio tasmaniensis]|uniref:hypothetical protein n=1 Tax=Vibrio tasmaniensis TaxID=212663 RepID=UPI00107F8897|nr:hypothetical protein [Vibrio tasmaniensis]
MLNFLAERSAFFLIAFCFVGLAFPDMSMQVFKVLPFVLFFLMFFSLLGVDQSKVIKGLGDARGWVYALVHALLMSVLVGFFLNVIDASQELSIALLGVAATGSLFATPAIVKSVGLDNFEALIYTITSTLVKPVFLYATFSLLFTDAFSMDMKAYSIKLIVYIFGPMLLSFLVQKWFGRENIQGIHASVGRYNIILVFLFPLGLVGDYGHMLRDDFGFAMEMLVIAVGICFAFFVVAYFVYLKNGQEAAYVAAITSGNRNVLLTYTIAGAYLGPLFLPLVGALQIPIYIQPLIIKFLLRSR